MQNRCQLDLSFSRERLRAVLRRLGGIALRRLLPAVMGFGLARTPVPGGIFPFGAAFAAALPPGTVVPAALGIVLGYIIPGSGAEAMRCAASALAAAGIRWALAELKPVSRSLLFPPAAALAGVVLTGVVVTSSVGAAVSYDLARYIAEGAMAAAGAWFFHGALMAWRVRNIRPLTSQERCCMAAALCVLCIPLCRLTVFGFSPFTALAGIAVLAVTYRMGSGGGAAAGIGLGTVLALANMRFSSLGVCAAAGLLASVFRPLGSVALSAMFCVAASLTAVASREVDVYMLAELALASVAFPIIRPERLDFIFDAIEPMGSRRALPPADDYISQRLTEAAQGLEEASRTVREVSERLERLEAPRQETVCRRASEDICADCAISRFCWETSREETTRLFDSLCAVLREDGILTRKNTPEALRSRCARWGEMSQRINALYARHAAEENARRRVTQVRRAVAGQMQSCGQLLSRLAEDSGREDSLSRELSLRAADALEQCGLEAEDVCCLCRRDGSLTLSLTLRRTEANPQPELDAVGVLSEELNVDFEPPAVRSEGNSLEMIMNSRPCFRLEIGTAQHSRGGGRLCGDAYRVLEGLPGYSVILLSDGMGTGGRAAVDAAMTCSLMSSLLLAGFSEDSAVRLVNSSVQISSDEETLSTMDCLRVNLYSGQLTVSKAGAASTYILKNGRAEKITLESLPLGIMEQADCADRSVILEPEDIIVAVSDGAEGSGEDWLCERLETGPVENMQRLAKDILALAAARTAPEDDDITVITARLETNLPREEELAA